jgi:hypothetical protein
MSMHEEIEATAPADMLAEARALVSSANPRAIALARTMFDRAPQPTNVMRNRRIEWDQVHPLIQELWVSKAYRSLADAPGAQKFQTEYARAKAESKPQLVLDLARHFSAVAHPSQKN